MGRLPPSMKDFPGEGFPGKSFMEASGRLRHGAGGLKYFFKTATKVFKKIIVF
jgi:hypothetical protein